VLLGTLRLGGQKRAVEQPGKAPHARGGEPFEEEAAMEPVLVAGTLTGM
jgi:hypothetical protein